MTRAFCLVLGSALCLAAWTMGEPLSLWPFADHMLRHMIVVAIATPLLALGLAPLGIGAAIPPLGAAVLEFLVVWGWHLSAAHAAAQTSAVWFLAEQASFFMAGMAIWLSVLAGGRELAGVGGLLLTSMHMTLLGALLLLAPSPLYPAAICGSLADQQVGGMLMLGIGTPVYLLAALALLARLLAAGRSRVGQPA